MRNILKTVNYTYNQVDTAAKLMLWLRNSENTRSHTKSIQHKNLTLTKGHSTRKTKSGDKKAIIFRQ